MECSESAKEHELLFNTEICPTLTIIIFLYPRQENLMPLSPYLTIKSFSEQFVKQCTYVEGTHISFSVITFFSSLSQDVLLTERKF